MLIDRIIRVSLVFARICIYSEFADRGFLEAISSMSAAFRTVMATSMDTLRSRLRSLRLRVLGLLILALLPVFGLMVFTASESRRRAMQETQNTALRLTELAASNQRQLIDGARDILIPLAQIPG